ncbi:hypothetical protein [Nostoc sp. CHAB 5715]|nr:hypothetical protein [Nostoc sp. CHAB 5715]
MVISHWSLIKLVILALLPHLPLLPMLLFPMPNAPCPIPNS